jgi:hypothetical protein
MPNFHLPAFCLLIAVGTSAVAQTAPDCSTPEGVDAARTQIETTLESVKEDQKQREAEIDRELESSKSSKKWSKERQTQLFMSILSSPKFAAFEKQKRPYTSAMMKIALSGPAAGQKADPKQVCASAIQLKVIVEKVKTVNAQQYTFMLNEVKNAK